MWVFYRLSPGDFYGIFIYIARNSVSLGVIRETFYSVLVDGKRTTKRSGHTVL